MRFEGEGVGYAHLTLPADTFLAEVQKLEQIAANEVEGCSRYRVCYLAGQSDVMLELRLRDFRVAFDLHSLHSGSEATGTNWLFGVPYAGPADSPESEVPGLRYIVHLRAVRDLLRAWGVAAEEEIVNKIQTLLQHDIHGEVLAGFGWSDFIVAGVFETPDALVDVVRKIQRLEVRGQRAFRRVLTLVGYDRNIDKKTIQSVPVTPVMFARAAPTRILEAAYLLARSILSDEARAGIPPAERTWEQLPWKVTSMDGKWDVLLQLKDQELLLLDQFVAQHRELAESGLFAQHGLERLETHLLSRSDPKEDPPDKIFTFPCSCQSYVAKMPQRLADLLETLQPRYLNQSVRNVLGLFRAASKDANNCCEVAHTMRRCEMGLEILLRHRKSVLREMADGTEISGKTPGFWFHLVAQANFAVQDWCTYAERIVSQRTVGRFEEFLSQNERVVSYRGGVQKLLYLTDSLLNSYALKIQPDAARALPLVCLFDPLDIVLSHRHAGIVRVPAQFLFSLPLAINHLWHEVGVFAFNQQHSDPTEKAQYARLVGMDIVNSKIREREYDKESRDSEMTSFSMDLADIYADATTLVYGFRGDLEAFILSFASTLFETTDFKHAPASIVDEFLVYLLTRLCLAAECRMRAELLKSWRIAGTRPGVFPLDQWRPHVRYRAEQLDAILDCLHREVLSQNRYRHIVVSEDVIERVHANVRETLHEGFRGFLNDVVWSLKEFPPPISDSTRAVFERIKEGYLCDLTAEGVDINDLFLLLQLAIIDHVRTRTDTDHQLGEFFQPIAALTRSSIVSFYHLERSSRSGVATSNVGPI
jgi:hypothetical protein